jgi:hypothetical protein
VLRANGCYVPADLRPADDPAGPRRRKPPVSGPPIPRSVQMPPRAGPRHRSAPDSPRGLARAPRPVRAPNALAWRLPLPGPRQTPSRCVHVAPWEGLWVARGSFLAPPAGVWEHREALVRLRQGVPHPVAHGSHLRSPSGAPAPASLARKTGRASRQVDQAGQGSGPGREQTTAVQVQQVAADSRGAHTVDANGPSCWLQEARHRLRKTAAIARRNLAPPPALPTTAHGHV